MTKKSILVEKRREAKRLRKKGWSIRRIARYLVCDKDSVNRWLSMDEAQLTEDGRGWPKGRLRKYSAEEGRRVLELKDELEDREKIPFGPQLIKRKYEQRYGEEISAWFIHRTLKEYEKAKAKERSQRPYLRHIDYVNRSLRRLGGVMMDLGFWGSKYGTDSPDRVPFLSCRYIFPHKFGIINRVWQMSAAEVMRILKSILHRYVRPDIVKMSGHSAFGANVPQPASIGSLTFFLLNLGIKPFYSTIELYGEPMWPRRSGTIFSPAFLERLRFDDQERGEIEPGNFSLEYKETGLTDEHIKTKNPLFMKAFSEDDLANRQLSRFLATDIFFYG
jgi:hypothetical protein